jgi:hypothetical protein
MTDSAYLFFIAPGAVTDNPVLNALLRSHEDEANKHGAEFRNYGQHTDKHLIQSKTNKARLCSWINPVTMEVTHKWEPYHYRPIGDSPFEAVI